MTSPLLAYANSDLPARGIRRRTDGSRPKQHVMATWGVFFLPPLELYTKLGTLLSAHQHMGRSEDVCSREGYNVHKLEPQCGRARYLLRRQLKVAPCGWRVWRCDRGKCRVCRPRVRLWETSSSIKPFSSSHGPDRLHTE
jgi:hypothetical protein